MSDNGKARVISIISGKGGVGKTTLVSNLSTLLVHKFRKHVLAVDANITTANLGIHMGLRSAPATLHDVLEDCLPISNAVYAAFGVDVIPAAHSIGNEKALRRLRSKIRPLLPYYDFVLLDSSPGLGLEARLALQVADELLLVTNPELSAVTEVIKMVELAKKKRIPVTGIVLNRVANRDYEVKVSEIEDACGEKVIAIIPEDISIPKSISSRAPAVIYEPKCRASRALESLAAKIAGAEGRIGLLTGLREHPLKILRDFTLRGFNLKVFAAPLLLQRVGARAKRSLGGGLMSAAKAVIALPVRDRISGTPLLQGRGKKRRPRCGKRKPSYRLGGKRKRRRTLTRRKGNG